MIMIIASTGTTAQIRIGQQKPDIKNRIISLTANGPELAVIKKAFANIPYPINSQQVIWKGEWAQHIFDNLDET